MLRGFRATGEWVALTIGEEVAAEVMQAIFDVLTNQDGKASFDALGWRDHWLETEQLKRWPSFFEDLRDLRVFAEEGVFRPWRLADQPNLSSEDLKRLEAGRDVGEWVRACAALIAEFVALAPEPNGAGPLYEALLHVRAKALARLNFDEGAALTPQELADLSGVSLKRVQNAAYEKNSGGPVLNRQGRIERQGAMDWLIKKGFRFSIWRQISELGTLGEGWGKDQDVDPALLVNDDLGQADEEAEGDYVFVPVASDRSQFLPDIRREAGYQIGPKGAEIYITDYFEALEALSRQPTPRWRRPNEAGNWGVVSAVAWERVPRANLERALALV